MSDGPVCISCQILALQPEESKDRRISLLELDVDRLFNECVSLRWQVKQLQDELVAAKAEAVKRNARIAELNAALRRTG